MNIKEEAYRIKYSENYRLELIRSQLKILENNYDIEYISKELIHVDIKMNKRLGLLGFSIILTIPSQFGNIKTEYQIGNSSKMVPKGLLTRRFKSLERPLNKLFKTLDTGILNIIEIYGEGSVEVNNYINFVNNLDQGIHKLIEKIPDILKQLLE